MFDEQLINTVKEKMLQQGQSIAVAESVTAGFLQAALASAENAAQFFQGGTTVYNLGQKCRHLAVNPVHAQQCDCVSEQVAATMASEVCRLFCADWGIGITGYASPVPQANNKLFAFVAIAKQGKVLLQQKLESNKQAGLATQLYFVDGILKALDGCLSKS